MLIRNLRGQVCLSSVFQQHLYFNRKKKRKKKKKLCSGSCLFYICADFVVNCAENLHYFAISNTISFTMVMIRAKEDFIAASVL